MSVAWSSGSAAGSVLAVPSSTDLRRRLADQLEAMCLRPGMYAPTAMAMECLLWQLMGTLAYLDECEELLKSIRLDRMKATFGPLGPPALEQWFAARAVRSAAAEVLAWSAEIAQHFDWLTVPRLNDAGWAQLGLDRPAQYTTRNWTRADVETELPPASLVVGRRVYCYAPPSRQDPWVYVDVCDPKDGPPWHPPDAPVRSVRSASLGFAGMILTPFGRSERTK
jgi:hypothetical protein